jgi:hypothetical protein
MRPVLALAFGALLMLPIGAAAQGTPGWSPWGGPDSPGGLFGGDPLEADSNQDRRVNHDEIWSWMRRRFDQSDRDRSGTLEPGEIATHPNAQASFRAADANRDGKVTAEELRPHSEAWFRTHDANGDGHLTRREVPQRKPARRQPAQPPPQPPPPG